LSSISPVVAEVDDFVQERCLSLQALVVAAIQTP
jgi:hypothetical protein